MDKKHELVTMQKENERLAVEPAAVNAHELEGWRVVGTSIVDADGNVVETGKVIETPAHTIETADHFLKTLPKYEEPPTVKQPVVTLQAVKVEEKPKK